MILQIYYTNSVPEAVQNQTSTYKHQLNSTQSLTCKQGFRLQILAKTCKNMYKNLDQEIIANLVTERLDLVAQKWITCLVACCREERK